MDKKLREVKIEYATLEDLPVIMNIMHTALELVEDKSWYAVDSKEFVEKCIQALLRFCPASGVCHLPYVENKRKP